MLSIGDLVITAQIPNHSGICFRLYQFSDLPGTPESWKSMVDKLYHNEVGILLEINERGMGLVLSPRTKTGWINMANLQDARK